MNKKFLSAILFGALMVTSTGTFVSCKDYDDDIENLQSQINNLATKSDVEAKLAQLQAAIDAAKAESAANAAKIAALTKCECDVDAMMAKIQDAVDADMAKYKEEIEALVEEVEALVGKVADFVTSVELISSETLNDDAKAFPRVLDFMTIIEKANIFEEDITGAIEFTKGKQTQVAESSLLVRVSPTNAVLSPEMVSLVNSKGQNLDEYVDIKVTPFTDLLTTTRSAENNGLWKLTVTLKEKDDDVFAAIKATDDGNILYAVQVNNALEAAEARYVTSGYDVKLGESKKFEPANVLDFVVTDAYGKDFNVAEINNRYNNQSISLKEKGTATMYNELTWATSTTNYPTPAVAGTEDNTDDDSADNRYDKKAIKAVQGEPITIAIAEGMTNKVRAIYVTLDKANAVESAPSELNAWNSYKYEGLNKVVEATSTTITVNASSAINDYIGFRVYAVNWDGTLVDPDGRAFYVLVGDQADEWQVAATTIVPDASNITTPRDEKSNAVAVTTTKLTAPYYWSWAVDKDNVPFSIALADKDGNVLMANATQKAIFDHSTTWEGTNIGADFKFEDIKTIYTIPAADKAWTDYKDNKEYIGTFTVKNKDGFVLATIRVSMTKVLPTAIPDGFTFKDKQVIDGVYNCYMEATDWTAGDATLANGKMKIENFINFGKGLAAQYNVTFGTSAKDADGNLISKTVTGADYIEVGTAYVDNVTEHATTVSYNFGKISSETKDANGAIVDYKITAAEFKTVYCCFYKSDVHTWGWITREQLGGIYDDKNEDGSYKNALPYSTNLTYGTPVDASGNATLTAALEGYVYGKNAIDGTFTKTLDKVYANSLVVTDAKLISDATQKVDYFDVTTDLEFKAIKTDIGSNPKADVPSTLIITCVDYYGHEVVIELPMTVKPRK